MVIMQGGFSHTYDFIPNEKCLPVYVGTYFTSPTQRFFDNLNIDFRDFEIGCRDLCTLNYFKSKHDKKAYFSRCLTLTLPKRQPADTQNKVFFVGVKEKFLAFIPTILKDKAIYINQQSVKLEDYELKKDWQKYYDEAQRLLKLYQSEARLVITGTLHCAMPCVAMGIPVILFCDGREQKNRFSTASGILSIYTLRDCRLAKVDFTPKSLDIEQLKQAMLLNLKLSIQKVRGESVDENVLLQTREYIANFNILE